MGKHGCFTIFSRLMPVVTLIIMACSSAGHSTDGMQKKSTKDPPPPVTTSDMANPAAKKCLADGYILEPVIENGISVGNLCINPKTDSACDVWEYFRNDCQLDHK